MAHKPSIQASRPFDFKYERSAPLCGIASQLLRMSYLSKISNSLWNKLYAAPFTVCCASISLANSVALTVHNKHSFNVHNSVCTSMLCYVLCDGFFEWKINIGRTLSPVYGEIETEIAATSNEFHGKTTFMAEIETISMNFACSPFRVRFRELRTCLQLGQIHS